MGGSNAKNQGGKSVSWGMGLITPLRLNGDDQDQSKVQWCMSGANPRKRLGYDQGPEPWTTTSAAYLPPLSLPLSQLDQRGLRRVLAEGRQDSKSWNTLQASTSEIGRAHV